MGKTKPAPLYEKVKDTIRGLILSGELAPLSRLPSQVQLCRRYDVSQITVRRAIQELTQDGLLTTRPGSGTFVAERKPSGRPTAVKNICVVMEDILGGYPMMAGYPLMRTILARVRQRCRASNYGLELLELSTMTADDDSAPHALLRCAGAILTSPVSVPMIRVFQRAKIPYVFVNNELADGLSHSVQVGFTWGVFKAAQHLYEIGCRDVVLVTAEELRQSAGRMRMGLDMAHGAAAGKRNVPRPRTIACSYEPDLAHELALDWIKNDALPDGAIYASDTMARAALFALDRAGVDVPGRTAVVGFGNTVRPSETPIDISVIEPNDEAVGDALMDVLNDLIQQRQPPLHHVVVEPKLLIRASSRR